MSFIFQSHWHGKFGNRMHQYAFGSTYKKINNVEYFTHAEWEGDKLFKNKQNKIYHFPETNFSVNLDNGSILGEARDRIVLDHFVNIKKIDSLRSPENYKSYEHPVFFDSLSAYSDNVFNPMDKNHLLNIFEFSDEVLNTSAYKYWSSRAGTYDIAHLRRDDISNPDFNRVNVQGYSVISKQSYVEAFKKYGFDAEKIEWTSDDYLNKWHTDRPKSERLGWSYPVGSEYKEGIVFDWLEDFLRLYFARTIFRANSSFSWWAAFLSPTATVYSPILNEQLIYGRDDRYDEIEVQFALGNEPHWMYNGTETKCIII